MKNKLKNKEPKQAKKKSKVSRSISSVLSGDFLTQEFTIKNMPFIFYLVGLMLFYIGWEFSAERTLKEINKADNDIKDLKMRNVAVKDELTENSLQSEIAKKVETMGLFESMDPPVVIKKKKDN